MNQNPDVSRSRRNYGIDLLRLTAAFYVIVLHTLNQGGVYETVVPYSRQDLFCRVLLVVSYCAVNIFGIISGYVGYQEPLKKISYSAYLPLWLTVIFYGALFACAYLFLLPGTVTGRDLARSFFPVTNNLYWYFSAYTLVFFFAPFLNKIIYFSSRSERILLLVLICCVWSTIEFLGDPFEMDNGYSSHWLMLLYLVGGLMKKMEFGNKIPTWAAVTGILLVDFCFLYLGWKWAELPVLFFNVNFNFQHGYITPFYLAAAMLHVIAFSRFRFSPFLEKLIAFAAPAAFSVYIANTNPLFWEHYLKGRFISWADSSPLGIVARTLLFSLTFVLAVVLVDYLRRQLFDLRKVRNWLTKMAPSSREDSAG